MKIPVRPMAGPLQVALRWSSVGWAVFAAFSLMLALSAVLGPADGPTGGAPGVRLVIGLPDPLKLTILGLFALSGLLVLVFLFPRGLRRRRKEDDEFELVYEEPKTPPWVLFVLGVLALLPLALAGYLLWLGWSPFDRGVVTIPLSSGPSLPALSSSQEPAKPFTSMPSFTGTVAFLALVAGLGCLGLILWISLGDGMAEWWTGPHGPARVSEPLIDAVEEGLDGLRREPDPRRAIILCYRRFEQVLAGSGLARAPWKTPTEFLLEALRQFALPSEAVTTLTTLFEVSRFSHHPVGPAERDAALGSLVKIRAALKREDSRGSVA